MLTFIEYTFNLWRYYIVSSASSYFIYVNFIISDMANDNKNEKFALGT